MNDFIIVDNFLHPIQQRSVEQEVLLNTELLWKYMHNFEFSDESLSSAFRKNDPEIYKPHHGQFFHSLIENETIVSNFYEKFSCVTKNIEPKFGLKVNKIFRMRVNFVTPSDVLPSGYTTPHFDHDKKMAKTLIYYITGTEGDTVLFEEYFKGAVDTRKKTIVERVKPKKGKAIVFDSARYHAGCFPRTQIRSIINLIFE
jgi:hypothetical protein